MCRELGDTVASRYCVQHAYRGRADRRATLVAISSLMFAGCTPRAATSQSVLSSPKSTAADAATRPPSNVVAVSVNHSSRGQNIPETTVTVCVPETTTCQVIPHIEVDTASTGLRVYAAALKIDLPQEVGAHGEHIGDCAWNYWGYLHTADVQLAGLKARSLPIQVIETAGVRPPECKEDRDYNPDNYNGMIGVSPALTDTMPGAYFTCDAHGCARSPVDASLQVANVIAGFPTDNNGCVLQFPAIPTTGTEAVTGRMIFGIGTRANNQLPKDLVPIVVDETWGQFKVEVDGRLWISAFDSGTWSYNVPYLSDALCPSDPVRLCPSSPLTIAVDVLSASGDLAYKTSIAVANYRGFSTQIMALNNLGTAWPGSTQFMLGLPYFFGRSVYFAYDRRPTGAGPGPWVGAR
jgi:hypothetical protein